MATEILKGKAWMEGGKQAIILGIFFPLVQLLVSYVEMVKNLLAQLPIPEIAGVKFDLAFIVVAMVALVIGNAVANMVLKK